MSDKKILQELGAEFYPKKGVTNYYNKFKFKKQDKIIDKETKMVSMGSCFAVEIANWFINNNYNYLQKESLSSHRIASADWGTVYNLPCMRQIFDYTFGIFKPLNRWWEDKDYIIDPYRKSIKYKKDQCKRKIKEHYNSSYEALTEADVIILTLGMTEIWKDIRDDYVFWRLPPEGMFDEKYHKFHSMTAEECKYELERIWNYINIYNKECKLILTVSPVPLMASFRENDDIIEANCESKCKLKVAVSEFMKYKKDGVYYFPSFEYTVFGEENLYDYDYRHVKNKNIRQIMEIFKEMYIKE